MALIRRATIHEQIMSLKRRKKFINSVFAMNADTYLKANCEVNRYFENGKQIQIRRSMAMNTNVKTPASVETVDKKPHILQRILFLHISETSTYLPLKNDIIKS